MTGDRPAHGAIADLGERALIQRIQDRAGAPPAWIDIGIGDDAAVFTPARNQRVVLTTDSQVEDVHFRRTWDLRAVGYKALAVNLSDLAAMGATPRASLLSLVLPVDVPVSTVDAVVDGFLELAAARAPLVGGNIARSPGPLVIDVTAIGDIHPRRIMRRSGGRPGDLLYVSGALGAARAGLEMRERGTAVADLSPDERACLDRFDRPVERSRLGRLAALSRSVTACMDLSDGLADAVRQIATASGTGAAVSGDAIPIAPGAAAWQQRVGGDPLLAAIAGGEDYELLFAVAPRRRRAFLGACHRVADVPVTAIGELTKGGRFELILAGLPHAWPDGFTQF